MKKIMSLFFVFCLIVFFHAISLAEPYKSKAFPSEQMIAKTYNKYIVGKYATFFKLLGKKTNRFIKKDTIINCEDVSGVIYEKEDMRSYCQ